MEKLNFNYSMKNIPIPSNKSYKLKLVEKIELVVKRIRWKAYFFLEDEKQKKKGQQTTTIKKETYGFRSKACPKPLKELESFETDLFDIIKTLKFRHTNNKFQNKLKKDIRKINESPNVLVFADKTSNIYELKPDEHRKLLSNNITKTYKKAPERIEDAINLEAKCIAEKLQLDDRIEHMGKRQAFITLKDHKEDFRSKPACRLLNPTKSEIGKTSKIILERINTELRNKIGVNQWKNSGEVIEWFKSIEEKQNCAFIQMDIKEFYPSIKEETLNNAISFANEHIEIKQEDLRIIMHSRKSLLYDNGIPWIKKNGSGSFDVTMGSYDGAETCEIVGLFILSMLIKELGKSQVGLYRDDGLVVVRNLNGQQTDRIRKKIINIFKEIGFDIEIETNLKEVDFLDITFNLASGIYRPYKKQTIS